MLSLGMLASRARSTAARSRMLPDGSPPPSFAAMMISRASLLNSLPRCWSTLDFLILMLCHLECPDTADPSLPGSRMPAPNIRRGDSKRLGSPQHDQGGSFHYSPATSRSSTAPA